MGADEKHTESDSFAEWVQWARSRLDGAGLAYGHGTDNAFDEAVWLVSHAAGLRPDQAASAWEKPMAPAHGQAIRKLVDERIRTRVPTAYLINEAWFAGRRYFVDERVLVPRSHLGEWIEDRFSPWLAPTPVTRILDLCTGSGCVAIACAFAFPEATVDASDISLAALEVAQINVTRHGVTDRVHLFESDLFSALDSRRYDLIVSNPPYVDRDSMAALPEEYRHEPQMALAGGADGLAVVERILREVRGFLNDEGTLVMEVGASAGAVERRYPSVPFTWLSSSDGQSPLLLITAMDLGRHARALAR